MMLLLSSLLALMPADSLTLGAAHRLAEAHFPRRTEIDVAEAIRDRRIEDLDARFLPALTLSAQASYASHVPDLGLTPFHTRSRQRAPHGAT